MRTSWLRSAAAVAVTGVVLATTTAQAHAASVTLTGWALGSANSVNTTLYSGSAGAFGGVLSGAGAADTTSFITYCVELSEYFSFSSTPLTNYAVLDGASYFQARRGDAGIAERLGRLLTFVAQNPNLVDTAAESTSRFPAGHATPRARRPAFQPGARTRQPGAGGGGAGRPGRGAPTQRQPRSSRKNSLTAMAPSNANASRLQAS